jgi:hypothetical protein
MGLSSAQFPLKIRIGGNVGYYAPSLKTLNDDALPKMFPSQQNIPKVSPVKGGILLGGTVGSKLDKFNVHLNVDCWGKKSLRKYRAEDNTEIEEGVELLLIPISLDVTYDLLSLPMISVYVGGGVGTTLANFAWVQTQTSRENKLEATIPATGTGVSFQLLGGGTFSPLPNFCLKAELGYVGGKVAELKLEEVLISVDCKDPETKKVWEEIAEAIEKDYKEDKGKPFKYDSNNDGTLDKVLPLELDGLKINISACLQF